MLKVLTLHQEHELQDFAEAYMRFSGTLFPVDFLRTSSVYGVYDTSHDRQKLVAGIVIRNHAPYRVVAVMRADASLTIPDSTLEFTGLFIEPAYRKARVRFLILIGAVVAMLFSRQKYLLACTTKEGLWRKTYQLLGAKLLYKGPLKTASTEHNGWVFILERRKMFRRIPLYLANRTISSCTKAWKPNSWFSKTSYQQKNMERT